MEAPKPNISEASRPAWVFYDGDCGLCHRWVVFALKHDESGHRFRFAPIGGKRFESEIIESARAKLPDSVVVVRPDRRLATKSDAVVYMLWEIGGFWAALSILLQIIPLFLRNPAYDGIAKIRKRLFSPPKSVCPLIPNELQSRFDLQ